MKNNTIYIPGDLAKLKDEVVTIVETELCTYSVIDSKGDFYSPLIPEDLTPILLTSEFLEKNGWKKDKGDYVDEDHHLRLCEKYEGYVLYKVVNKKVMWLMDTTYVHELQHLLFGLGLNNRLEV